jgi:uncharacterized protein
MPNTHGSFVWYELMTTDAKAGEAFYSDVVGWSAEKAQVPGVDYTLLKAGSELRAGMVTMPAEVCQAGWRPGWMGYVAADDVDATARRVSELGGKVHREPQDIPGVGRFAVVADPHGAVFALMKWEVPHADEPPAPGKPGNAGWRELYAGDLESAFEFYSKLFGWTKADAHDMGPMGVYQIFALGGETIGGMMTKPAQVPTPGWNYYFNVDAVSAAAQRAKSKGGEILNGPTEVPGGSWIVQGRDPQGATFALLSGCN